MNFAVSFKDIITLAIERNVDMDKDGNLDGFVFAAEQILQDMEKHGYEIRTRTRKKATSGMRNK